MQFGQGDRLVDLLREGVDCVIRAGEPEESGMIIRRLLDIPEVTCASPAYLARRGTPATLEELEGHAMVGFLSSRTGAVAPLEFQAATGLREILLPSRVTVNDAESLADLARLGFGLIQAPRYRFAEALRRGELVEVLPAHPPRPTPLSVLYPQNRQLAPRVGAFVDWVVEIFREATL